MAVLTGPLENRSHVARERDLVAGSGGSLVGSGGRSPRSRVSQRESEQREPRGKVDHPHTGLLDVRDDYTARF